jgi:hypothetical protein
MTGKGTAYVAPIFPVAVMTKLIAQVSNLRAWLELRIGSYLQIKNPKKVMGITSLTVKPKLMTLDIVLASGGASMSEHQYAYIVLVVF